jgi:hypothetical protein
MRTSAMWTKTAIVLAGLGLGSALAQETPVKGAGPDQDQANNERYWGIVNNSNNSYKTWPSSLRDSAFDKYSQRHHRAAPQAAATKAETPPATPAPAIPAPAPAGAEATAAAAAPVAQR